MKRPPKICPGCGETGTTFLIGEYITPEIEKQWDCCECGAQFELQFDGMYVYESAGYVLIAIFPLHQKKAKAG